MLVQILNITAPVFLLALSGYLWARADRPFDLEFVTQIALAFALPCLIFHTLVETDVDPQAFRDLALAALAAYAALGAITWAGCWLTGLSVPVWWAPVVFGNTGNVGLPIALFAYGQEGLALAVIVFAVMAILSFTIGIWVVAGAGRPSEALRQPLVYASILGGVFAFAGWSLPKWLMSSLELAGQIAIPLMLLTLGVAIARLKPGELMLPAVLGLVKLAVTGAVAVGVALAFGLTGVALGALVLQLIMPAAVTNYLLAARYKRNPEAVAGLVVISTLMAFVALPVALAFLLEPGAAGG